MRIGSRFALAFAALAGLGAMAEPKIGTEQRPKERKGRHDRRNSGSTPVPGGGAKERARRLARMQAAQKPERLHGSPVCVWKTSAGWYWDDAEDHGGFDRVSPSGPFLSAQAAEQDALACFTVSRFERRIPDHYPEGWTP